MSSNKRRRVNYQQRFENYLDHYRRRYRFKHLAITAAAIVFAAVVVTLFTAVLGDTLAYSAWLYYPARIILAIAVFAVVMLLLIKPLRKIKAADGATELEATVPEFAGRAETYLDMKRRRIKSPFVSLLAKDASKQAANAPVRKLLPAADIVGPVIAGTGLLVMCGWLLTAVPLEWRAGMQHFWFGWFKSDILPERSIALEPGDTKLRVGDSLAVTARLTGFNSHFAELHIRKLNSTGDGDWETIDMNRQLDGSFVYTMYGISDPLDYYVTAAFTKSAEATVEVVVPAKIENLQLTYRYPEWTGREPRVVANGTDIAAVANTEVDLLIVTNKPLTQGELMLDGVAQPLTATGELEYQATLTVDTDTTSYRLADLLGDDRIMLTPEYSITVTEDASPTISFTQPTGDWNATAIEEVTVVAKAADDFAVENVTLHYSLNGGEWASATLDADNAYTHVFMLEEFTTEFNEPLLPGDLLTYYAEASDREQSTSTDIQFIDIRPFERRYTQSQQSNQGGGGGQQEPPPGEISQRQKEILVATWNLIKEQEAILKLNTPSGQGAGSAAGTVTRALFNPAMRRRNTPQNQLLQDNAELLADLQNKLAEQAEKLAERAEARQLLEDDPKIAQFVEYMQKAADSMRPSAEQLGTQSLQEAVRHQQRALQFLRRGELLFNDITINQNQGNGSGNSAGRDMAEIYELEMDLAKNQYETPDAVQPGGNQSQPEDDALEKLKELARRQHQLAEAAARKDELSMTEKWQQEKLRRELEELKRELEQLQRNASQNQSAQNSQQQQGQQQQGQQSQGQQSQGQQSQGGEQGGQQQSAPQDAGQQQAMQNLEQAIRDLQNADANQNADNAQQSMESASRRLQESLEQMQAARQQRLQNQLDAAADDLRELTRQQLDTAQQLREAMQRSIEARAKNEFTSGLSPQQQRELAEQKRDMQRSLEEIKRDLADAADRFAEDAPRTSEKLQSAIDQLDATKAAELMGISGDLIEEGLAAQAALRERRITEALRNLQDELDEAGQLAVAEAGAGETDDITAADASQSIQELRQALTQALNQGGQSGSRQQQRLERSQQGSPQQGSGQQGTEQQNGQQGGQQQSGQQQGGQQPGQGQSTAEQQGTSNSGQPSSWGQNRGTLAEGDAPINGGQPQLLTEAVSELERIAGSEVDGLSQNTLTQMQELAQRMRQTTDSPENDRRIDAEVKLLLRQIEQLELQVYRERQGISGVRSARTNEPPKGFSRRSADYFRRLSEEATGS